MPVDDFDEAAAFFSRRIDKSIISRRFPRDSSKPPMRYMSKIIENDEELKFVNVQDEVVLHRSPGGRFEIKATVLEDSRGITGITIQRYLSSTSQTKEHFWLSPPAITKLLEFVAGIRTVPLPDKNGRHVTDEDMRAIVLDRTQLSRVLLDHSDRLAEALENENFSRDLVAVGYRRSQLKQFERLLNDVNFFNEEMASAGESGEKLWQSFFEKNKWIFGYSLAYHFLGGLDSKKLEQVVAGSSIAGVGKRADALMKTQGLLNSLCFVEIKKHDTGLLSENSYRSGVWHPSKELTGGVAQIQVTVHEATENLGRIFTPTDTDGNPLDQPIFNIEPRSFLVIGSLGEFHSENGINERKFRSFELYRRNTRNPEIITFDELLYRAKFIVEHVE